MILKSSGLTLFTLTVLLSWFALSQTIESSMQMGTQFPSLQSSLVTHPKEIGEKFTGQVPAKDIDSTVFILNNPRDKPLDFRSNLFFIVSLNTRAYKKVNIMAVQPKFGTTLDSISLGQSIDQSSHHVLMNCTNYELEECHVPTIEIPHTDNMEFLVFVSCEDGCSFTFESYFEVPQIISIGESVNISFDDQRKAKAFLIDGTKMTRVDMKEVRIILEPIHPDEQQSYGADFLIPKMYGNIDLPRLPTKKDHDLMSWQIWDGGQGIFLSGRQLAGHQLKLLLFGEATRMYTLSCELIKEYQRPISYGRPFHDFLDSGEQHYYDIDFATLLKQDENSNTLYSLTFSIYSGNLEIGIFIDEQRKLPFETGSFKYTGNTRYVFSRKTLQNQNLTALKLKIKDDSNMPTTFTCTLQKQRQSAGVQIIDSAYTFTNVNTRQLFYYKFTGQDQGLSSEGLNFRMDMLTHDVDTHKPLKFRICLEDKSLADCLSPDKIDQSTKEILIVDRQQSGVFFQYRISIQKQLVQQHSLKSRETHYLIMDTEKITQDASKGFVALYFRNYNEMTPLDAKGVKLGNVQTGSTKYFVYGHSIVSALKKQNETNVEIRISIIGGKLTTLLSREDLRNASNYAPGMKSQNWENAIQPKQVGDTDIVYIVSQSDFNTTPLYLSIQGHARSRYIIMTKIIQIDNGFSDQNSASKEDDMDTLKIEANKDYNLKVKSAQNQVIQMRPTGSFETITFKAKGSEGFGLCQLQLTSEKCRERFPTVGNNFDFHIQAIDKDQKLKRRIRLRIFNLDVDNSVQITVNYQEGVELNCLQKQLGKVEHQVLHHSACFRFPLSKYDSIEGLFHRVELARMKISVKVCGQDFPVSSERFTIPTRTLIENCVRSYQYGLKSSKRASTPAAVEVTLSSLENTLNSTMKVLYSMQHNSDLVTLAQGIAYDSQIPANQHNPSIKRFYFNLLSIEDTTILVSGINLPQDLQIYAKVVQQKTKQSQKYGRIGDYTFSSAVKNEQLEDYFSHKRLKITKDQLDQTQCIQNCVLIIQLYATSLQQRDRVLPKNSLTIEVFQDTIILSQHEQYSNFLLQGSTNYYRYDCSNTEEKVLFEIQNNNQQCARIYVGDSQYPDTLKNDPKPKGYFDSYIGNSLEAECKRGLTEKKLTPSLFFAVEALEDCPITASIQSTKFRLKKLRSGIPIQLKLKKGEVQYFLFSHYAMHPVLEQKSAYGENSFKFMSIESQGDVNIYINRTTDMILSYLNEESSNENFYREFAIKNSYRNSLEVDSQTKGYCEDCQYIAAVEAKESTSEIVESTIIFLENPQQTEAVIIMQPNKVLYDEIQNELSMPTVLKYHRALKGTIYITVLDGSVRVVISHGQKQIKKDFKADKQKHQIEYNFVGQEQSQSTGIGSWTPITVEISNIEKKKLAVYKIYMVRMADPTTEANYIQEGFPEFLSLSTSQTKCVKGILKKGYEQKFYVTKGNFGSIPTLTAQLSVNNITVEANTRQFPDSLQISYQTQNDPDNRLNNNSSNYLLCLTNNNTQQAVTLSILQSSGLNLLLEDSWALATDEQSFIIHPPSRSGKFMVDALVCRGQLSYFITDDYAEIQKQKPYKDIRVTKLDSSSDMDVKWKQQKNHVFYAQNSAVNDQNQTQQKKGNLGISKFLYVAAQLARVRWIKIDEEKEIGMGYINYGAGQLEYQFGKNSLQINFDPIKAVSKDVKTTISKASYRVIIGKEAEIVKSAANCWSDSDSTGTGNFYSVSKEFSEEEIASPDKAAISISKEDIRKNYLDDSRRMLQAESSSHIMLVADISLKHPNSTDNKQENYRFLYKAVTLPTRMLLNNEEGNRWVSVIRQHQKAFIISVSIVSLLGVVCICYICLKKVAPTISRIWHNRAVDLAEEREPQSNPQSEKSSPKKGSESPKKSDSKPYMPEEGNPEEIAQSAENINKLESEDI